MLLPFNFKKWIDENRQFLKPPVGNRLVWKDTEFIVMVVGGPNARSDFHVNEGEEFFYQLEGDIVLKVFENNKIRDIPLAAGDVFLLPPRVPHSPQRPAGSVGLVIERRRAVHEKDGFQWYCPKCEIKVYEEFEHVSDIVAQLPPIFERFYSNTKNSTCQRCGYRFVKLS